jgi:hypothetical protein
MALALSKDLHIDTFFGDLIQISEENIFIVVSF